MTLKKFWEYPSATLKSRVGHRYLKIYLGEEQGNFVRANYYSKQGKSLFKYNKMC
jgi:hypothetical protein